MAKNGLLVTGMTAPRQEKIFTVICAKNTCGGKDKYKSCPALQNSKTGNPQSSQ